jgi:hypothetical protein
MRQVLVRILQFSALVVMVSAAVLVLSPPAEAELGACCDTGQPECEGSLFCCDHGKLGAAPCSSEVEDYCREEC